MKIITQRHKLLITALLLPALLCGFYFLPAGASETISSRDSEYIIVKVHNLNNSQDILEKVTVPKLQNEIQSLRKDIERLEKDNDSLKKFVQYGITGIGSFFAILFGLERISRSKEEKVSKIVERQEVVSISNLAEIIQIITANMNSNMTNYEDILVDIHNKVDIILSPELRLLSPNPLEQDLALQELYAKGTKYHLPIVNYYIEKHLYANEELKTRAQLVRSEILKRPHRKRPI